jgi:hypothetical protein
MRAASTTWISASVKGSPSSPAGPPHAASPMAAIRQAPARFERDSSGSSRPPSSWDAGHLPRVGSRQGSKSHAPPGPEVHRAPRRSAPPALDVRASSAEGTRPQRGRTARVETNVSHRDSLPGAND